MKNGIASSTKLSMPRAICCAKITPGSVPSTQMKISAASASAKPIGNPPNNVRKKPSSISVFDDGTEFGDKKSHARQTTTMIAVATMPASTSPSDRVQKSSNANTVMNSAPTPIG